MNRGFVYDETSGDILEEARKRVMLSIEESSEAHVTDPSVLQQNVRQGPREVLLRGDPAEAGDPAGHHGGVGGQRRLPRSRPPEARSAGSRLPSKARQRSGAHRRGRPTRQILSPWARDALGIGLVVLAGLAVLSVWIDAAGPAGRGLAWLLAAGVRRRGRAVPAVGVWWGVVLLRDVAREDRVRMFIGFVVLGRRTARDRLAPARQPEPRVGLRRACTTPAGLVGALVAWPLSRVLSSYGAFVVCLGLAVLGLLIFTGTPVAAVIEKVREVREERAERDPVGAPVRAPRTLSSDGEAEPADATTLDPRSARPRADAARGATSVVVPESASVSLGCAGRRGAGGRASRRRGDPRRAGHRHRASRPQGRDIDGHYHLPPIDLLRTAPPSTADGRAEEEVMEALERTLITFGVDARVTGAHRGPTVTMYEIEVAAGTKVQQGAADCPATSHTRSRRRTSGSSRRSPGSRRSASRCRTSIATS